MINAILQEAPHVRNPYFRLKPRRSSLLCRKMAMEKFVTLLGSVALFATCGFGAFDADTIAFYPFTDKEAGEGASTGDLLTNAVSEAYQGTVKLFGAKPTQYPGSLTFEKFPFPYVYSDSTRTNLLTSEAQAIHVQSNGVTDTSIDSKPEQSGAAAIFGSVAQALADWGGDYTIEVFWKIDVRSPDAIVVSSSIGASHDIRVYKLTELRLDFSNCTINYGTRGDESYALWDGTWHHLGILYDSTAKTITFVGDYTVTTKTATEEVDDIARYFSLGASSSIPAATSSVKNPALGMKFACPRFTKRKLTPTEFMYAYDKPIVTNDVVFHWSFDGEDEADIVTIADRNLAEVGDHDAMKGQYAYAGKNNSAVPPGVLSAKDIFNPGNGVVEAGETLPCPRYNVEANRAKSWLWSGQTLVTNENFGAAELNCQADEEGAHLSKGRALRHDHNLQTRLDGAFTMECICRLDLQDWSNKVIAVNQKYGTTRWRTSIGGMDSSTGDAYGVDQSGVVHLRVDPEPGGTSLFTVSYLPEGAERALSFTVMKGTSTFKLSNDDFDACYHHFALTYDPATTNLGVYVDYEPMNSRQLEGPLVLGQSKSWLFGNGFNNCAFDGSYDEIRVSRRVLSPSEFLVQTKPKRGLMILFR